MDADIFGELFDDISRPTFYADGADEKDKLFRELAHIDKKGKPLSEVKVWKKRS